MDIGGENDRTTQRFPHLKLMINVTNLEEVNQDLNFSDLEREHVFSGLDSADDLPLTQINRSVMKINRKSTKNTKASGAIVL